MEKSAHWSHSDLYYYTQERLASAHKDATYLLTVAFPETTPPEKLKTAVFIHENQRRKLNWEFKQKGLQVVARITQPGQDAKHILIKYSDIAKTTQDLLVTGGEVVWFPPNYASFEEFDKDLATRMLLIEHKTKEKAAVAA